MPDPEDKGAAPEPGFVISIPRAALPRLRPEAWVRVAAGATVVALILAMAFLTRSGAARFALIMLIVVVVRVAGEVRKTMLRKRK